MKKINQTFNSYYLEMGATLYKIGEGERKLLSKDMQEIILAYQEEYKKLEEENETLKDKIEFLTNCLDDRDKSIELLKEELEQYKKQEEKKTDGCFKWFMILFILFCYCLLGLVFYVKRDLFFA